MKKIVLFLFSLSLYFTSIAKTVVIGTGSGSVSQTSMTGLVSGDILAIAPGTYANGTFSGIHDITIINNGGVVYFTGTLTFGSGADTGMNRILFTGTGDPNNFYGFYFTASSDCIRMPDHHYVGDRFNHIYAKKYGGDMFNFSDSYPTYVGTTASFRLYKCTFSDLRSDSAGQMIQGSFGAPNQLVDLCDSIDVHNVIVTQTTTNGIIMRGLFTHYHFYNWNITYNGVNPLGNDIGAIYIGGSGRCHHMYMKGGRGYIIRHYPSYALTGQPDDTWFYDNIAIATNEYGAMDWRIDTTLTSGNPYFIGTNLHCNFNTSGNKTSILGYVAPICLVYNLELNSTVEFKNNVGFNLAPNNPGPFPSYVNIISDDPSGFARIDTSNNRYYTAAQSVGVFADTSYQLQLTPTSPLIGTGVYNANILTDFLGRIRANPPSIGAEEYAFSSTGVYSNAGSNQSFGLPTNSTTLDGSASSAINSTITSYAWSQTSGPNTATIVSPSLVSTSVTGLIMGTYVFKLTVGNAYTNVSSSNVTIVVTGSALPLANAGNSQTITLPTNNVTLNGLGSTALSSHIVSYKWVKISGPSKGRILSPSSAVTNVTGLILGVYVFKLTIVDNVGNRSTATTAVTVL